MKHFAIIGAGTAGIATAALLARQGFKVTIFEKVRHLDPVGAGLLLQPAGLAVFEHLGVLDHAVQLGAKVTGLEGQLSGGSLLVNSHYHEAGTNYIGLGIHRSALCHVLQQATYQYTDLIDWQMNTDIVRYQESSKGVTLFGKHNGETFEQHVDAILIANGAKSQLRPQAWVKIDKPYPWGAAWTILPECLALNPQILHQFYHRSHTMMGILPTGSIPTQPHQRLSSIFWSMPTQQLAKFKADAIWLDKISPHWKDTADWFKNTLDTEQIWLNAQYRDVVMSKYGAGRVGVLGDAAHAMSPQLGQGANMALLDAWALSQAVHHAHHNDWTKMWQQYHQLRQSSIFFYQSLSRLLTPMYQSDSKYAGKLRDLVFPWMYRIPYFRKEMAITISGLKTTPFSQRSYQDIAQSHFD